MAQLYLPENSALIVDFVKVSNFLTATRFVVFYFIILTLILDTALPLRPNSLGAL